MTIDRQRLARAIAISLAEDGYIDLFREDGEDFLEGKADRDITGTAEAIADRYDALVPEEASA